MKKASRNKKLKENKEFVEKMFQKSRLTPLEIIFNSGYLVSNRPKISNELSTDKKIESIVEGLGIKGTQLHSFDTYYGMLTNYAWHGGSTKAGAEFTPINYLIDELHYLFQEDRLRLNSFKRRLKYLAFLRDEIKYVEKRFDFDKIPILSEWLTNKFENFTTLLAELSLLIIEYHAQKTTQTASHRIYFENLINEIINADASFNNINTMIEGFIAVTIRNNIVHSIGFPLKREDGRTYVIFEDEKIEKKFTILQDYVKDTYSLFYNGKRTSNSWIRLSDPRFPYLTMNYKVTKKGTINWPKTTIRLHIELKEYLKIMSGFLFILSRTLFEKIIKAKSAGKIRLTP